MRPRTTRISPWISSPPPLTKSSHEGCSSPPPTRHRVHNGNPTPSSAATPPINPLPVAHPPRLCSSSGATTLRRPSLYLDCSSRGSFFVGALRPIPALFLAFCFSSHVTRHFVHRPAPPPKRTPSPVCRCL